MKRVFGAWMSLALGGCMMVGYDLEPLPSPKREVLPPSASGGGVAGGGAGGAAGGAGSFGTGSGAQAGSGPTAGSASTLGRTCMGAADGAPCDDQQFCTEGDTCKAGACVGGPSRDCSSADSMCSAGVCKEDLDVCFASPIAEGEICDDGALCIGGRCALVLGECVESTCDRLCLAAPVPCSEDCGDSDRCNTTCTPLSTCVVSCGASECKLGCRDSAICTLDCSGAALCEADCAPGSLCIIDCEGAVDCSHLRCAAGAQCIAQCEGAQQCAFEQCPAGQVSCDGGLVVCGRPCPS